MELAWSSVFQTRKLVADDRLSGGAFQGRLLRLGTADSVGSACPQCTGSPVCGQAGGARAACEPVCVCVTHGGSQPTEESLRSDPTVARAGVCDHRGGVR